MHCEECRSLAMVKWSTLRIGLLGAAFAFSASGMAMDPSRPVGFRAIAETQPYSDYDVVSAEVMGLIVDAGHTCLPGTEFQPGTAPELIKRQAINACLANGGSSKCTSDGSF